LQFDNVFRQHSVVLAQTGPCLVDHIHSLARKGTARDATTGVIDSVSKRVLGIGDAVKLLVLFLDPEKDLDRVGFSGGRHNDRLKVLLQPAVVLN
jgi:hypothetical protein